MCSLVTALVLDFILILAAGALVYESALEQEIRATLIGIVVLIITTFLACLIVLAPAIRWTIAGFLGTCLTALLIFFVPGKPNTKALQGSMGSVIGDVARYDERDMVFARNRLRPGTDMHSEYYSRHPERLEYDSKRRDRGGSVGVRPGAIDKGHRLNMAMTESAYSILPLLGKDSVVDPYRDNEAILVNSERASDVAKGYALHLGADVVGICKVNPLWAYSHRGECHFDNWDDWGLPIDEPLPYAVVIGIEMSADLVNTSPHTPAYVETRLDYAKGVYVTTILANWFGALGYKAVAHHRAHYDLLMVPLAVDAGLGQMGRFGYLINYKLGGRLRIFAVTTDMPLIPNKPVDLGVEEFCAECKKCAVTCPSHSIPDGDKTVVNGIEKWAMNAETCYEYWGNVGTACAICMGICPYSRPYRSFHKLIRWTLARSLLARKLFPHIDNIIYGQKWKPKSPPNWINFRK